MLEESHRGHLRFGCGSEVVDGEDEFEDREVEEMEVEEEEEDDGSISRLPGMQIFLSSTAPPNNS